MLSFNISKVSVFQKTGIMHAQETVRCEDVVYQRNTENFQFCGLADGQSGKQFCVEGGGASLEAVADFLEAWGMDEVLEYPFRDELPCLFVQAIRKRLSRLSSQLGCGVSQCASTLVAIAVEATTGRYLILHLGDGAVIGIGQDDSAAMLSEPENGLTAQQTWLTTSPNAVGHFRVEYGTLNQIRRILLLSDGVRCFCQGKNMTRRAKARFLKAPDDIGSCLDEHEAYDDATCIILDMDGSQNA